MSHGPSGVGARFCSRVVSLVCPPEHGTTFPPSTFFFSLARPRAEKKVCAREQLKPPQKWRSQACRLDGVLLRLQRRCRAIEMRRQRCSPDDLCLKGYLTTLDYLLSVCCPLQLSTYLPGTRYSIPHLPLFLLTK